MKVSQLTPLALAAFNSTPDYYDESTDTCYYIHERVLTTHSYQQYNTFTNQPYVSNGYIGARIPNLGQGFTYDQNINGSSECLKNGWPLFNARYAGAFLAGFFDLQPKTEGTNFPEILDSGGYESVLSAIPQWTTLTVEADIGGAHFVLDPAQPQNVSDYTQALSMQSGIVSTSYIWHGIAINYTVLAHQSIQQLGLVNLNITVHENVKSVNVTDTLDFATSQRCWLQDLGSESSSIYMTVTPENVPYKSATIYSTLGPGQLSVTNTSVSNTVVLFNGTTSVTKAVGISSDDLFATHHSTHVFESARQVSLHAISFESLLQSHVRSWNTLWGDARVTIENDPYLTLAGDSSIYHLLANTRASNRGATSALGVSGLSSDSYGGMVFWDTDMWVLPALLAFSPANARSLTRYRSSLHAQAVANAQSHGYHGSVYPWTSGRFGNCTATGPCVNYEYHINVAICFSYWKLYLSGVIGDEELHEHAWPLFRDTARFFSEYVEFNQTLGKYTTRNLTDPDEYANFKDNAAFTAFGISQVMKWATLVGNHLNETTDPIWKQIMANMYVAQSQWGVTLEYDTMTANTLVKQADVSLISYIDDHDGFFSQILGYNRTRAQSDLAFYADRQAADGPAMTWPAYLAVSQKLSEYGCGYHSYLEKSVRPYLRFPFAQMSEQDNDDYDVNGGTHPAFPFLTGHGGVLQSYCFGLLGLRYTYTLKDSRIQSVLHVDPVSLPRFHGKLLVAGFRYLNESIDIEIDSDSCGKGYGCTATFKRKGLVDQPIFLDVANRNEQCGLHELSAGSSVTIPLYVPGQNLQGSITECTTEIAHSSRGFDGDVPAAILDGDNSTFWQAADKTEQGSITIDLGRDANFSRGTIIWGHRPARVFQVEVVTNSLASATSVEYVGGKLVDDGIRVYELNYTNFDLGRTVNARYVTLNFLGIVEEDEDPSGAKVVEFSLY